MRSTFGKNINVSIWGGSHEPAIGVDIEGIPVGTEINMEELQNFMARRAPGSSPFATKRSEPDIPVPLRGVEAGASQAVLTVVDKCISFEIRNTDTRSADYKALGAVPRPGHADYTARLRYGSDLNMAGGGPFSARMTAPLCIAGGIAVQMLEKLGVHIGAHIYSVADVKDTGFDPVMDGAFAVQLLGDLKAKDFPVIDTAAGELMKEKILAARDALDSVGGIVEAVAIGLPGGIGGAMYDGLESALAPIFFGIPAVKGVEFGAGFDASTLKGSENNDPYYFAEPQDASGECQGALCVKTRTNNHGGVLGGITTGMPLITRLAFKPTPSIALEQDSIDLDSGKNTKLVVKGRHDPCVVLRAVPVVEAALALGILDSMMNK